MTIGLTMVVRDAEETLPRLLASLDGLADPKCSTIVDTGSTDATREIVRRWGVDPVEARWDGFAASRTKLMEIARGRADYLLLLDADMEVERRGDLEPLTADVCTAAVVQGPLQYPLPILVRGSMRWEYRGAAHAALAHDGDVTLQRLTSLVVHDRGGTAPEKFLADIGALWDELRTTEFREPRAWYYLAQSYRDLGRTDEAIVCYSVRSATGGLEEERWDALYQAALLVVQRDFGAGAAMLLQAWQQRPQRAEPLRALAAFADAHADEMPVPEDEILPVRPEFYGRRRDRDSSPTELPSGAERDREDPSV